MTPSPSLRRMALAFSLLAGVAYVLIVLGALVRVHDAGLSCPDWPLCHGEVVPAFADEAALRRNLVDAGILGAGEATRYSLPFQVALEWGHRALVGVLSLGLVAAAAAVFLDLRARAAAGPLVGAVLAVLGVQVVLGGLTVLELLARWTVTSHLLVGNLFCASLVLCAVALHRAARPAVPPPPGRAATRAAFAVATVLFAVQLGLGGLVASSYAGLACTEWPTCNHGVWFPTFEGNVGLQVLHRLTGYSVLAAYGALWWVSRRDPGLSRLSAVALALVVAQVAVGVANVLLALPVAVTALHSAGAAAISVTTALLGAEALRRPVGAAPAERRPLAEAQAPA